MYFFNLFHKPPFEKRKHRPMDLWTSSSPPFEALPERQVEHSWPASRREQTLSPVGHQANVLDQYTIGWRRLVIPFKH